MADILPPRNPFWDNPVGTERMGVTQDLVNADNRPFDPLWMGDRTLGQAQDAVANAANMALAMAPIRAYHGSPHLFDRFDAAKIGTGEGAQAYGRGLYFAENEGVARSYQGNTTLPTVAGGTPDANNPLHLAASALHQFGSRGAAIDALTDIINRPSVYSYDPMVAAKAVSSLKNGDALPSFSRPNSGHMYEVDLNVRPEQLLNWDRPLRAQSPEVLDALQTSRVGPDTTVRDILKNVSNQDAANRLRVAGVPGLRYLDAGSRGAGEGTHNYVMFPGTEDLISILRRYGVSGVVGGNALMDGQQ